VRDRNRLAIEQPQSEVLDLNLRSLDIFVQIAESGGMSSTARRMRLTQSAVSQMIGTLEKSLGVKLFDRQVRPIALTPSGAILLERSRGLLLSAREAIHSARQPVTAALPKLNLCLVETIAGTIGPDLVRNIQEHAALWSVHSGLHSQHNRSLLLREADIVITPDSLEDKASIERHEILKERFFIALPKTFSGEVKSLKELAGARELVRYSARTMLGRQIEQHLRRRGVVAKGQVEFDDSEAVLAMVADDLGWALLTPLCAIVGRAYWKDVKFVPIPAEDTQLTRRLHVVARQGELGDIPGRIAAAAVASIKKIFHKHLSDKYSWMYDDRSILESPRPSLANGSGEGHPNQFLIAGVQPSPSSARQLPSRGLSHSGRLARSS
jgi:DNA-binding transcriptional LysR family regulator